MTILRTNQDIINNALFNAGESQNSLSDYFNQALIYYNRAHRAICAGGSELDPDINESDWSWLRKSTPGVLTLQPARTGTAAVTFNNSSVTLSSAPSISLAGYIFSIPGDTGDYYQISSHTAGSTGVVLDSPYTGTTNAAASYTAFPLEYTLASDFDAMIGPMRVLRDGSEVNEIDLGMLLSNYPLNSLQYGTPVAFAFTGEQKVRFNTYPGVNSTDILRVEYDYKMRATDLAYDTGEPLLPLNRRGILSDYTTMFILIDKADDKQQNYAAMAQAGLRGMAKDNSRRKERSDRLMGQIQPRQDQVGKGRVPRSTSGFYFFR